VLPSKLVSFLPDDSKYGDCSYYTSCFLRLSTNARATTSLPGRTKTHQNDVYLQADNHLAYHRLIDPNELNISEKQKLYCARTMRLLGLHPYYHLTELETLFTADVTNEAVWDIFCDQLKPSLTPTQKRCLDKKELLAEYLQAKSQGTSVLYPSGGGIWTDQATLEVSKQPWPQLMMMSTSDAVVPT
jgi:hypothetical protein